MEILDYKPTIAEVGRLFGKSGRWISELSAAGHLPPAGSTLSEFVKAWAKYHVSLSAGSADNLNVERARLARAQADAADVRNRQVSGELVPAAEMTAAVQSAFIRVRSRMLALPTRAAPLMALAPSAAACEAKLTELVHEALLELASTEVVEG